MKCSEIELFFFRAVVKYQSLNFSVSKTSMNPFSLSVQGSLNTKMFHVVICHQIRLQLFYSIISEEKLDSFVNEKYTLLIRWLQGRSYYWKRWLKEAQKQHLKAWNFVTRFFFHVVVFFFFGFFCTTMVYWFNTSRSKVAALLHEYHHNTTLILNPGSRRTH